jgi:Cu(I)/Ag(I) efflux system membrane fusion protein
MTAPSRDPDSPAAPPGRAPTSPRRLGLVAVVALALGLGLGLALGGGPASAPSDPDGPAPHAGHGAASAPGSGEATVWTCAMHPQIRQPEPGACPLCGMDLVPVQGSGGDDAEGSPRVRLGARARALARLRTTPVRRRSGGAADLRLLGRVEPSETTLKTVTAWTGGRIDRLHVRVTGARVRPGQVIATLYSPEVLAAHQDLLVAGAQARRLSGGAGSTRSAADAALSSARERLRLLGVPDDELARMERAERPTRAVPIRTPFGGTVLERLATEGAYVTTGAPLYRVADLGTLWIQLDAYEADLSRLAVGQSVRVEVEAFPSDDFDGRVTFIDPTLDPRRRTARVRVEVANRDGRLRPGMFAHAVVEASTTDGAAPLVVPATAPLFTGRRAIVYVEVADGERTHYEPRTVRLGPRLDHLYPVVAGLAEGERVVSRGAFAIDADLQIRGGDSMMSAPDDREPGAWDEALDVPRRALRALSPVVVRYLEVQRALAADDLARAQSAAREVEASAGAVKIDGAREAQAAWLEIRADVRQGARRVGEANSIEMARAGFESLSDAVAMLVRRLGNPLDTPLLVAHCPMAFGSRGATWLQQGATIDNAYFGAAMRTCGEVEHRVEPGAHLPSAAPVAGPASEAR